MIEGEQKNWENPPSFSDQVLADARLTSPEVQREIRLKLPATKGDVERLEGKIDRVLEMLTPPDLWRLNLSVRSFNCLNTSGIRTIERLKTLTDDELRGINNLGKGSLREIRERLLIHSMRWHGEGEESE